MEMLAPLSGAPVILEYIMEWLSGALAYLASFVSAPEARARGDDLGRAHSKATEAVRLHTEKMDAVDARIAQLEQARLAQMLQIRKMPAGAVRKRAFDDIRSIDTKIMRERTQRDMLATHLASLHAVCSTVEAAASARMVEEVMQTGKAALKRVGAGGAGTAKVLDEMEEIADDVRVLGEEFDRFSTGSSAAAAVLSDADIEAELDALQDESPAGPGHSDAPLYAAATAAMARPTPARVEEPLRAVFPSVPTARPSMGRAAPVAVANVPRGDPRG